MAAEKLNGKRVAILATDGVEEVELTEPRKALDAAGAKTSIVSPQRDKIKAWQHDHWGSELRVDIALEQARADDYFRRWGRDVELRRKDWRRRGHEPIIVRSA